MPRAVDHLRPTAVGHAGALADPATWPDGKVPGAGDMATIAAGKDVVLDVSPPALGSLTIEGTLSFADTADLALTTEWIMVHGELEIGTEARPHTRKATVPLTNNVPDVERRTTGHDTWTRLPPGNAVRPCECASANSSARREIYCVPSEEQRFNRRIRDPASGR